MSEAEEEAKADLLQCGIDSEREVTYTETERASCALAE